jgi:hypothetical protein
MLGQGMLTDMNEYEASESSVYDLPGDFTERDCGYVERSAATGSKRSPSWLFRTKQVDASSGYPRRIYPAA